MEKRMLDVLVVHRGLKECLAPYDNHAPGGFDRGEMAELAGELGLSPNRLWNFCCVAASDGVTLSEYYRGNPPRGDITSADYPTLKEFLALKLYCGANGDSANALLKNLREEAEYFAL
jgi:hypothetical protein